MRLSSKFLQNIFIIFICTNFFYINGLLNYKILFILGNIFLIQKLQIKWLILLLIFLIIEILIISISSSSIIDRFIVLFSTLLIATGYFGWVSLLISRRAYDLPVTGYILIILFGFIFRSSFVAIDPLILVLIASLFLHEKTFHSKGRLSELIMFVVGILYSILSGWRSAVLGFTVGLSYTIFIKSNLFFKIVLILISSLGISYLTYFALDLLQLLRDTGSAGDPSSGRFAIISTTVSTIYEGILNFDIRAYIGYGIGSFGEEFSKSMFVVVDILGVEINSLYEAEGETRLHAHNFILQTLYELGLIGMLLQLFLIFKMHQSLKEYRVFIYIGIVSGLLSGVFYFYSEYFIVLLSIYLYKRKSHKLIKLNG